MWVLQFAGLKLETNFPNDDVVAIVQYGFLDAAAVDIDVLAAGQISHNDSAVCV